MRITYRNKNITQYWEERWAKIEADSSIENKNIYPLKYSEILLRRNDGKVLEAGCGMGRLVRYYKSRQYDIVGMDFVKAAIGKLKSVDPQLWLNIGDVKQLPYKSDSFKYVLAFGLFHSLQDNLQRAIEETHRILKPGGKICASMRADNIQTRLTDWLAERQVRKSGESNRKKEFHKLNVSKSEMSKMFGKTGFEVEDIFPAENMPALYKFSMFRAKDHKQFNETVARREGYRLSGTGKFLQKTVMKLCPDQFCNLFVLVATKK